MPKLSLALCNACGALARFEFGKGGRLVSCGTRTRIRRHTSQQEHAVRSVVAPRNTSTSVMILPSLNGVSTNIVHDSTISGSAVDAFRGTQAQNACIQRACDACMHACVGMKRTFAWTSVRNDRVFGVGAEDVCLSGAQRCGCECE